MKNIVNNGPMKEAIVNGVLHTIVSGENEVIEEVASFFVESYGEVEYADDGVCGEAEEVSEGPGLPEPAPRVRRGKQ